MFTLPYHIKDTRPGIAVNSRTVYNNCLVHCRVDSIVCCQRPPNTLQYRDGAATIWDYTVSSHSISTARVVTRCQSVSGAAACPAHTTSYGDWLLTNRFFISNTCHFRYYTLTGCTHPHHDYSRTSVTLPTHSHHVGAWVIDYRYNIFQLSQWHTCRKSCTSPWAGP